MVIEVVKEFTFDAAHFLPKYDGPCGNMHGHTYRLRVGVKGPVDENVGMVADFVWLEETVGAVLEILDHTCLNELWSQPIASIRGFVIPKDFRRFPNTPTAENMVVWLRGVLRVIIKEAPVQLSFIRLWETPTSYAEWRLRS